MKICIIGEGFRRRRGINKVLMKKHVNFFLLKYLKLTFTKFFKPPPPPLFSLILTAKTAIFLKTQHPNIHEVASREKI
jgi:hypothetical protein